MSNFRRQIENWSRGLPAEVIFWDQWLRTGGLSWPHDYQRRLDPNAAFDNYISLQIDPKLRKHSIALLDVGSGPLTDLGYESPDFQIRITACDVLADVYNQLMERHGISPIVQPVFATAEDLSAFFDPSSYDIVHCRNALDHCFDPLRGIIEMLRVVRVDGKIILRHRRNEGQQQNYQGLHSFNFDVRANEFVIWSKEADIVINPKNMPVSCEVSAEIQNDMVHLVLTKKSEFSHLNSPDFHRQRRAEVILAVMQFLITNANRAFKP